MCVRIVSTQLETEKRLTFCVVQPVFDVVYCRCDTVWEKVSLFPRGSTDHVSLLSSGWYMISNKSENKMIRTRTPNNLHGFMFVSFSELSMCSYRQLRGRLKDLLAAKPKIP